MAKKKRNKLIKINESLPKCQREGQVGINSQGLEMVIENYKGSMNINIKFLIDGYKIEDRTYQSFLIGQIHNPNFPDAKFIDRTGERRQNTNGDWMEIIACYGYNNNTVKFDDDKRLRYNISWDNFNKGYVDHPFRFTDSLYYNYPEIARAIANEKNGITLEDTERMACTSGRFYIKCINCGKYSSKKKNLYDLIRRGMSCEYCSDKISIPNKMLRQIAIQLNLNWQFEYNEPWMGKHKFDAYDVDLNQPIEADAEYKENHKGKRKKIDNWKDEQAVEHDMKLPIRIDLMNTKEYDNNKFEYIKQQYYKYLGDIYDLNKIDWDLAWKECQNSLVIEACRLWRECEIYSTIEIGNILSLSQPTVIKYLKIGRKLNLCNYTVEKANEESGKKRSNINNYNSDLYWIIMKDKNKYKYMPLCLREIYNNNSKGFLNIGKQSFDKYIKPYNNIDIERIKQQGATNKLIEKLTPFDGWQFIPLSKEEKQQYLESINNQQPQ